MKKLALIKYVIDAFLLVAVLTALSLLLGGAAPARAGVNRGELEGAIRRLAEQYAEVPVAQGSAVGGGRLLVFASPETGTWTIGIEIADGVICQVATGTEFGPFKPQGPAL